MDQVVNLSPTGNLHPALLAVHHQTYHNHLLNLPQLMLLLRPSLAGVKSRLECPASKSPRGTQHKIQELTLPSLGLGQCRCQCRCPNLDHPRTRTCTGAQIREGLGICGSRILPSSPACPRRLDQLNIYWCRSPWNVVLVCSDPGRLLVQYIVDLPVLITYMVLVYDLLMILIYHLPFMKSCTTHLHRTMLLLMTMRL